MYTYSFRIWDVCIHTADSLCCKAETQHRKAITLQLKKKKNAILLPPRFLMLSGHLPLEPATRLGAGVLLAAPATSPANRQHQPPNPSDLVSFLIAAPRL